MPRALSKQVNGLQDDQSTMIHKHLFLDEAAVPASDSVILVIIDAVLWICWPVMV